MFWDRFDIAEAYYLFFVHYHSGKGSPEYRRLSKMSRYFKPRPGLRKPGNLTENSQEIYWALVRKHKGYNV